MQRIIGTLRKSAIRKISNNGEDFVLHKAAGTTPLGAIFVLEVVENSGRVRIDLPGQDMLRFALSVGKSYRSWVLAQTGSCR